MEIKISLDKIQNGIMQLTAILGRNRQDMKIAVTQDNLPAIGIYIGEAVTEAENELRRHLISSNSFTLYKNESYVTVEIKDYVRNAKSIINSITGTLELYLIHYTITRWIGTIESLSNLATSYQESAAGYLSKIIQLVTQRDIYTIDNESYQSRMSDTEKLSVTECNYKQRENDNRSIDSDYNAFDKEEYFNRKRDLDPTGRTEGEWPREILTTTDNKTLTDNENNILVSQPENIDYNENQD